MTDRIPNSALYPIKRHLPHPDQRPRWHVHEGMPCLHEPDRGSVVTRCGRLVNPDRWERDTLATGPDDPECCRICAKSERKHGDTQPVKADTYAALSVVA